MTAPPVPGPALAWVRASDDTNTRARPAVEQFDPSQTCIPESRGAVSQFAGLRPGQGSVAHAPDLGEDGLENVRRVRKTSHKFRSSVAIFTTFALANAHLACPIGAAGTL